jgi:N-acetylneuraminic acid mutarotase
MNLKVVYQHSTISKRSLQTSVLHNNKLYVYGGESESGDIVKSSIYIFDLSTKVWSEKETKLTPVSGHSCIIYEDSLVFYGGRSRFGNIQILSFVDTESFKSTNISEFDYQRICYHSCNIYGDSMIIFGGCLKESSNNFITSSDVCEISLVSHSWKKRLVIGEIPENRCAHASILFNDILYVHGGCGDHFERYNDTYKFNLKTNTWNKIITTGFESMRKSGTISFYYNQKMILYGGGDSQKCTNEIYEICLKSYQCKQLRTHPTELPNIKFASISNHYENIYVFGGKNGSNKFNEILELNLISNFQINIFNSFKNFIDIEIKI